MGFIALAKGQIRELKVIWCGTLDPQDPGHVPEVLLHEILALPQILACQPWQVDVSPLQPERVQWLIPEGYGLRAVAGRPSGCQAGGGFAPIGLDHPGKLAHCFPGLLAPPPVRVALQDQP